MESGGRYARFRHQIGAERAFAGFISNLAHSHVYGFGPGHRGCRKQGGDGENIAGWQAESIHRGTSVRLVQNGQAGGLPYFAPSGSPSVGNSNSSPPVCTIIVPGPKALPLFTKNTAPSVDSPEPSLVETRAMAAAAAPAFNRSGIPTAKASSRRRS